MEEDSYIISNFHSICRLCLRKNGVMCSIFEYVPEDNQTALCERLAEISDIQIEPNDGLPARICHKCLYKAEKFLRFKTLCSTSDTKLRRLTTRKMPTLLTHIPAAMATAINPSSVYGQDSPTPPHGFIVEDSVVMVVDPSREDDSSDPEEEVEEEEIKEVAPTVHGSIIMCQFCDKAFTQVSDCKEHEQTAHNARAPFGCEPCNLVFVGRAAQALHLRVTHGNTRPYPCVECEKSFSRRSDLRKHSVVHTGVRPFQCQFCHKNFSRNTNLSKHLRIHSGQRPHVCPQCPRSFISKADLERHFLIHTGAKPFSCSHCPLTFARRDKLQKHEAKHERILQNSIKNDEEDEKDGPSENIVVNVDPMKDKDLLENDNSIDDSYYPSVPDHITGDSSFALDRELLKEDVGDSIEEYETDEVVEDAPVETVETVRSNTKATVNQRFPHLLQCQHCALKFSSHDAYNKHILIHSGVKQFFCNVCSKSFARKRELDRHSVVHTGFKPFACTRCDKKFGRKDKLVRHERIHDEKKDYSCFECTASFTRKDSLVNHLKTHYPDLVRDNMESSINSDLEEDEECDETRLAALE